MNKIKRFVALALGVTLVIGGVVGCGKKEEVQKPKIESAKEVLTKAFDNIKKTRKGSVTVSASVETDSSSNKKDSLDATVNFNFENDISLSVLGDYKSDTNGNQKMEAYAVKEGDAVNIYFGNSDKYQKLPVPMSQVTEAFSSIKEKVATGSAVELAKDFDYSKVNVSCKSGVYTLTGEISKDDVNKAVSGSAVSLPDVGGNALSSASGGAADVNDTVKYTIVVDSKNNYSINTVTITEKNTSITANLSGLNKDVSISVPDNVRSGATLFDISSFFGSAPMNPVTKN